MAEINTCWRALQAQLAGSAVFLEKRRGVAGTPDVLLMLDGTVAQLELKQLGSPHWVTREQALYLYRWRAAGGRGGVLCRSPRGRWLYLPAQATRQWVTDIQRRVGACPALPGIELPTITPDHIRRIFFTGGHDGD